MTHTGHWGAILAGGEGQRLRDYTRILTGDDRPKQFCKLFGRQTLLEETRARVFHSVAPARTLYVVSRSHEPYYRSTLADTNPALVVEQPCNRGTAAAVAYALTRIRQLEGDGVIGFFPADHYYRDPVVLHRTVAAAYALADTRPDSVILLGAQACRPETEYGWIETGAALSAWRQPSGPSLIARAVTRFSEKPGLDQARDLLKRQCLWNTFVSIGRVGAFEALMADTVPSLWGRFAPVRAARTPEEDAEMAQALYADIGTRDFSRDVLAARPERLAVLPLPESGWTDLGQASRVLEVLSPPPAMISETERVAG